MDRIGLSLKMRRLAAWLDARCQPDSLSRKQLRGSPFGNCLCHHRSDRQGPFASANLNRVYLCGTEAGMEPDGIARLIDLFRGGRRQTVLRLAQPRSRHGGGAPLAGETSGLSRIRRTGYPTLCRKGHSPVHFSTDLEIRQVSVQKKSRQPVRNWVRPCGPEFAKSAGEDGFFHYMAFDDSFIRWRLRPSVSSKTSDI